MRKEYLEETEMLNFRSQEIKKLVVEKQWSNLSEYNKIKSVYEFVQNDILFGYNSSDTLNAVQVLHDGFGQCNTKSTLLMALLRSVNVPCRLNAFNVSKDFQKGAIPKIISWFTPEQILHTWVEVYFKNEWIILEGVITDKKYLSAVQKKFSSHVGLFKGYAIAVKDLQKVKVDWTGGHTYVQKEAIIYDYGIFNSPDEFFSVHSQDMSKIKEFLYRNVGRKIMTKKVDSIRNTYTLLSRG